MKNDLRNLAINLIAGLILLALTYLVEHLPQPRTNQPANVRTAIVAIAPSAVRYSRSKASAGHSRADGELER